MVCFNTDGMLKTSEKLSSEFKLQNPINYQEVSPTIPSISRTSHPVQVVCRLRLAIECEDLIQVFRGVAQILAVSK